MALLKQVKDYWDLHHIGTQFLSDHTMDVGSEEFFIKLDSAMERWEYKNKLMDWMASKYPNGRLLEIGCGLGQDLVKLSRRGLSVTGIDLAYSVANTARRHLVVYNMPGRVLQSSAEDLGFQSNRFDVAYSCGVLQHTPDIQRAIDEIYRVIRKGGMAVVVVYHRYSLFNLLATVTRTNIEFEDKDPPIINTYSKRELYRLFSKFQSVDIDLEYYYPTPTPRKGIFPGIYNRLLIPTLSAVPAAVMKNFGWHAVVKARK